MGGVRGSGEWEVGVQVSVWWFFYLLSVLFWELLDEITLHVLPP